MSWDLRHFIRVYDGHLSPDLCARMIHSFGALQRFQLQNGAGVRRGLEQSAWTELNVTRFSDPGFVATFGGFVHSALEQYNRDVGLQIPVPPPGTTSDLVMKRYRGGSSERFQLHFDAVNHLANRYLVLLWYLNDVEVGGATRFPQLDGYTVQPRTGRLLVFPPYWMYQHEGVPPESGDKYILSTYLLFTRPADAAAAGNS